jgi:hypothetical protein
MAMQDADGTFYNFVFADGRINRLGITSRKGAGFWAARALWAMAEGMPDFAESDPAFAERLRAVVPARRAALPREGGAALRDVRRALRLRRPRLAA